MKQKSSLEFYLPIAYVVVVLLATIVATKISFFGFFPENSGVILYPFTFILHDLLQKKLGRKVAIKVIRGSAGAMLFASLVFKVVSLLPADANRPHQLAFDAILTPMFRITIASITAGVMAELVNTRMFGYLFNKGYDRFASIGSNLVSLVVDATIFINIGFLGVMPTQTLIAMFIADVFIKIGIVTVFSPSIYLIKRDPSIKV